MQLPNKALLYGDNLGWLRDFPTESVDLIYLDPPFNSDANYNVIFREHKSGTPPQAQITAFEDTWSWSQESARSLDSLIMTNGELGELLDLLVRKLGHNALSAYLVMMAVRLVQMNRILKETGSLYLHCDPTASHYLKMISDMIFGPTNFRNEIIWKRSQPKSHVTARFPNAHDVILFYAKSEQARFQVPFADYNPEYIETHYPSVEEGTGRRFGLWDLNNPNKDRPNLTYEFPPGSGTVRVWRWTKERMTKAWEEGRVVLPKKGTIVRFKRYLDEMQGTPVQDVFVDIDPLNSQAKERLGYPTQKPVALLERLIEASSKPGELVLDPFCGCGTAVVAAEKLGRRWIGIDITHLAVSLMKARLRRDFELEPGRDYTVDGTPESLDSAQFLFDTDPFQFQFWLVGAIGAQPYGATSNNKKGKKGGDTGIDGLMYFRTPGGEKLEKVIASVKGGKTLNPAMVRDLRGVVERDKAAIGVFLCLAEPTKGMREEAAKAGFYKYGQQAVPKLQVLTVADVMAGQQVKLPMGSVNVSLETKTVKTTEGEGQRRGMSPLFNESDADL